MIGSAIACAKCLSYRLSKVEAANAGDGMPPQSTRETLVDLTLKQRLEREIKSGNKTVDRTPDKAARDRIRECRTSEDGSGTELPLETLGSPFRQPPSPEGQ
ncbi:hypothetical protein EJ02DRAFT_35502 [Clathrospora elynae]|uniref:Uncharacterized protein n=1 Tax=Clathrospora elynae TaxID=706981 RepID=A0A6A5T0Z2_9PLEO|nr:hypothetical protein EJ02DRAFT_35502 [Clathrospora elynae]